jgi:hypothetical protein
MGFRFLGGTGMDGLAPTDWHIFYDDFDKYTAGDWTITTTEAGGGSASEAIGNAKDGVLVVTNDAADDDADFFQFAKETFKYVEGKPLYFGAKFKVSDATQSDLVIGLQITDTTPLAVTDGIYFRKDDGDANLDCVVIKDSTSTGSLTAAATLSDDTWTVLEFYYDGVSDNIVFQKDGVAIGSIGLTNVPDDEELTISFGIQNGEAVAKILSIDWIRVGQLRG